MKKTQLQHLDVTPAIAARFLAENLYSGQRPLSPSHVDFLAQLMIMGQFRNGTVLSFACIGQNVDKMVCVNGQHTLHAIVKSGITQSMSLEIHHVKTSSAIAELYASYDRGRQRSILDAYTGFTEGIESGLERNHISWLSAAIPIITSGFNGLENYRDFMAYMRNAATRWHFIREWMPEMRLMISCNHNAPKGIVTRISGRAAVLAVALVTLRYQEDAALTFWRKTVMDDGLANGDPAKTLLRFLLATPAVRLKPHAYARYVASAWNAAFDQKSLVKLIARESSLPILLKGTPHRGIETLAYYDHEGKSLPVPQRKA